MGTHGALKWMGEDPALQMASEAAPTPESSFDGFAHHQIILAMKSLPQNWQAVLWRVEVLGQTPDATATALGLSDSDVTAALVQAREGLRRAYGR